MLFDPKEWHVHRIISISALIIGAILVVVGYLVAKYMSDITGAGIMGGGIVVFVNGLIGTGISLLHSTFTSNGDSDSHP
jgi:hypothetical protein